MVVYVDVLLVVNIIIDYFLLLLARALLRKTVRRRRILLGALLGGAYALVIFLPPLPVWLLIPMHIGACILIILAAFPVHGLRDLLKSVGAYFAVSFIFAGLMLGIYLLFRPQNMAIQNGAVYFDLNIRVLLLFTLLCYGFLTLLSKLLRRRAPDDRLFDITLTNNGKCIYEKALLDTGHGLSDGFSDRPVLIAEPRVVKCLAPSNLHSFLDGGAPPEGIAGTDIRLIPYASIGGKGMLRAISVSCVSVPKRCFSLENVLLAQSVEPFAGGEYSVLLCSDFFERGGKQHVQKNKGLVSKTESTAFLQGCSLHKRPGDFAGAVVQGAGRSASETASGRGDGSAGRSDRT